MSWPKIKKKSSFWSLVFSYSVQQQWTVSRLDCDMWLKMNFIWQLAMISSVVGLRKKLHQFSSVQSLSRLQLFATPWIAACQASLSITNSQSLLKLMPIKLVMPSSHLILSLPLLLLPAIPPSWSFSFSISPSNEHPGLISLRMDWLDLLSVQGTLKSLLQHHSSKVSIFWHSAFFTIQLSHPYMITGKTIALTRWTF